MITRFPHWRDLLLPIGFVLAGVVITITLWRTFGGTTPLQPHGYRVTLPIEQASNLGPNADVRIAGVPVGKVTRVRVVPNRVLVTVELQRRYAPLHTGARALLRTKSLLGESYLELQPGPRTAPRVPEDGQIDVLTRKPAQQLDDVLSTFDAKARRNFRRMVAGLAGAFDKRGADVNNTLGNLAPTSTAAREALAIARQQTPQLRQLVRNGSTVLTAVGERRGAVQALISSSDALLGATAARDRDLAATINALPEVVAALDDASRAVTAATPDLAATVHQLRLAAPDAATFLAAVDRGAPALRTVLTKLPALSRAGRRGLPALTRTLAAAGPALDVVYPTLRELMPVIQLASGDRDTIVGTLANIGSVTNGRVIGPNNLVSSTLPGISVTWNEAIGGFAKRLPTNRQNSYPKPLAQRKIETTGLESYDCRNTGNPALVPAFGAAPPCREQGPWTFNDKSAYFPRLSLAPPAKLP